MPRKKGKSVNAERKAIYFSEDNLHKLTWLETYMDKNDFNFSEAMIKMIDNTMNKNVQNQNIIYVSPETQTTNIIKKQTTVKETPIEKQNKVLSSISESNSQESFNSTEYNDLDLTNVNNF